MFDDVLVDEADKHLLDYYVMVNSSGYAVVRVNGVLCLMHRLIIKATKGQVVDHRNRNRLDNRRSNLRIVSQSQNLLNAKLSKRNKTGYKYVSLFRDKYRVFVAGKYLGCFDTVIDANNAIDAYKQNAIK